jgi:hypothetical protein
VNPPQLFPLPNPADFALAIGSAFPDLCTINEPQAGSADQDQYGVPHGPALRVYTPLVDHVDIQCAVAPEGGTKPSSSKEKRTVEFTQEWDLFDIQLNGYYPLIKKTHQAVVAGVTYEIQGINSDVYKVITHLHCRLLSL